VAALKSGIQREITLKRHRKMGPEVLDKFDLINIINSNLLGFNLDVKRNVPLQFWHGVT